MIDFDAAAFFAQKQKMFLFLADQQSQRNKTSRFQNGVIGSPPSCFVLFWQRGGLIKSKDVRDQQKFGLDFGFGFTRNNLLL